MSSVATVGRSDKANESLSRTAVAEEALRELVAFPCVVGLCLIGSMARGDYRVDSDIDILVAVSESQKPSELLYRLPHRLRERRLSLICKSRDDLSFLAREGSLFLSHVQLEGLIAYDPEGLFEVAFRILNRVPPRLSREVRSRVASLRHYRHLERFGGNFLFALAHLYGLGKGIAIARSAENGRPVFVKSEALSQLAASRPELCKDIEVIQRLRPFYDLTRGHRVSALPFSYIDADTETRRAVAAVEHIADLPYDFADAQTL